MVWTRGAVHLAALQEGADRIDLHGQLAGKVTASEAEHALAQLERRAKRLAQKKLEPTI